RHPDPARPAPRDHPDTDHPGTPHPTAHIHPRPVSTATGEPRTFPWSWRHGRRATWSGHRRLTSCLDPDTCPAWRTCHLTRRRTGQPVARLPMRYLAPPNTASPSIHTGAVTCSTPTLTPSTST